MAVGTVVMNRVASPRYPNTICGVVGQRGQFAYGVLTSPLDPRQLPPVERAADAILAGERYKPIGDAMWFHVAGLRIPYRVQYMSVAGGNAFYRKTGQRYADIRVAPGSATVPARVARMRPALAEAPQQGTSSIGYLPAPTPPRRVGRIAMPRERAWARSLLPARTRLPGASIALEHIQAFPIRGGIPKSDEQCESSIPWRMEGDHGAGLQPGFA